MRNALKQRCTKRRKGDDHNFNLRFKLVPFSLSVQPIVHVYLSTHLPV